MCKSVIFCANARMFSEVIVLIRLHIPLTHFAVGEPAVLSPGLASSNGLVGQPCIAPMQQLVFGKHPVLAHGVAQRIAHPGGGIQIT